MSANIDTPQPGDAHYPFYRHLLSGKKVHYKSSHEDSEKVLSLASLGDAKNIQCYGYRDLLILE